MRIAGPKWLWMPAIVLLAVIRKLLVLAISVDLHPSTEIGPGLLIAHGAQIRVIEGTRIGADCALIIVCTIGGGTNVGGANIGDHVFIGCHSCILSSVAIGDVTVLTPLLTARAVAVEDGSAHARWLGRRWVGGWFFGGCSRRRLSRREGTAAQATALVGSCGAGRFARAAAMRRPA